MRGCETCCISCLLLPLLRYETYDVDNIKSMVLEKNFHIVLSHSKLRYFFPDSCTGNRNVIEVVHGLQEYVYQTSNFI